MGLTHAQEVTLKADMNSVGRSAALGSFITAEDWFSIADYYNQASGSTVWRDAISIHDLNRNIVGSAADALSVGKQQGYLMLTQGGSVDATSTNVRAWFQDIFGAGQTLTNLTAEAQRSGTRFELLFSSAASPSNVTTVGGYKVTPDDIQQAMLHG